jgi:hypothetical protein
MPDPHTRNLINDLELVELAHKTSMTKQRTLRFVKEDGRTDGAHYEDVTTGERQKVPNKFIKSLGLDTAFELMSIDPKDLIPQSH